MKSLTVTYLFVLLLLSLSFVVSGFQSKVNALGKKEHRWIKTDLKFIANKKVKYKQRPGEPPSAFRDLTKGIDCSRLVWWSLYRHFKAPYAVARRVCEGRSKYPMRALDNNEDVLDLDIGCWDPSGKRAFTTHVGFYWVEEPLLHWNAYKVEGYNQKANRIFHSGSKGPRVVKWTKWWRNHRSEKPKRLLYGGE